MKIILGLDPGLASTGYGVIAGERGRIRHLAHGVIRTDSGLKHGRRLALIHEELGELCKRWVPTEAAVEKLFFARNAVSAIAVAEARGVTLCALEQHGIALYEYPPQVIKQAVVGEGRADKRQVQELVRFLLALAEIPKPDHAADALAAAICRYHSSLGAHATDMSL